MAATGLADAELDPVGLIDQEFGSGGLISDEFLATSSGTAYTQTLDPASLSFSGSFTKQTARPVTAGLTFVGTFNKLVKRSLTAILQPTATLFKNVQRPLTAAVSFVGTFSKRVGKALTAGLTFLGSISKTVFYPLNAGLTFVGALSKQTFRTLTASLMPTGVLQKLTSRPLTAALSFVGAFSVSKLFLRAFTAGLTFVGSFSKVTGKSQTAALTFIGSVTKFTSKGVSGSLSFVGNLNKSVRRALTASLSFVGSFAGSRLALKAFTAGLSFVGAISKQTGKSHTAALSFVGAISKKTSRALTAALNFVGALTRFISHKLTAALTFSGALTGGHLILKAFTAALSFVGSTTKRTGKSFSGAVSFSGNITRRIGKVFSGILGFLAGLVTNKVAEVATDSVDRTIIIPILQSSFEIDQDFAEHDYDLGIYHDTQSVLSTLLGGGGGFAPFAPSGPSGPSGPLGPSSSSPVSYWFRFNEVNGTFREEISGTVIVGGTIGPVTFGNMSLVGDTNYAFGFDGVSSGGASNSYLLYNNANLIGQSFSISFWMAPSTISNGRGTGERYILQFPNDLGNGTSGIYLFNDSIVAKFYLNGTYFEATYVGIEAGKRYLVFVTYDNQDVLLYVNNDLVGGASSFGGDVFTPGDNLIIGGSVGINSGGFAGVVDELAVYIYTVGIADVQSIYEAGNVNIADRTVVVETDVREVSIPALPIDPAYVDAWDDAIAADNPIHWWRFDNAGFGSIPDSVTQDPLFNFAFIAGSVIQFQQPGLVQNGGFSIRFDGVSHANGFSAYKLQNQILPAIRTTSLEFWFNCEDTDLSFADPGIIGSDGTFGVFLEGNIVIQVPVSVNTIPAVIQITGPVAALNQNYHVILVLDTANIYLYVNGSLVFSNLGQLTSPISVGTQFYAGRSIAGTRGFAGRIDELIAYDHSLSASRAAAHYAAAIISVRERYMVPQPSEPADRTLQIVA